jgi:enoyl-CoA hydratase/carnithine racemase/RimJ/RimL family protein N-acetyltransferase
MTAATTRPPAHGSAADSTAGPSATGLIHLERRGPVVLLGLNRPAKYNALDEAMVDQVDRALLQIRREPGILVVYSTTPGVFAAGADIAELIDRDADAALRSINAGLFDRIEAHRWPTIAAVDGPAFGGGCELALACDLRVGTSRARFAQPELGLGILAGAGANWRLPQAVGLPLARRMLYTGEVLDADAAAAAGLIDTVHPADELLDQAIALAERIATRSWRALELTKLALRAHRPATTSLDVVAQAVLFEGADKRDRMNRFLDERTARRAARATGDTAAERPPAERHGEGPEVPDPVPPFRVRQLTIEDGLAAAGWSSPGAWRIEDALEAPEPDEGYWAVVDAHDSLIGFCCLGAAARVPGQPADEWVLDVSIGIRPQLAGRGWGGDLGRAAVAYARSVALDRRVRTTVPDWNDLGRHAAEQAGFVRQGTRLFHHQRYDVFEQPI